MGLGLGVVALRAGLERVGLEEGLERRNSLEKQDSQMGNQGLEVDVGAFSIWGMTFSSTELTSLPWGEG